MARTLNSIFTLLALLLISGCAGGLQKNADLDSVQLSTRKQFSKALIGEWKYDNTVWYSSEIRLSDSGVFTFHDQSCFGQKVTQGQWIESNGVVMLTSFDRFKPKERSGIITTTAATDQQQINRIEEQNKTEYLFTGFDETKTQLFSTSLDTVPVYFKEVQLRLSNDTLYSIGSNDLPETKFYRMKSNG